jgi:hypothetical protein
MKLVWKVSEADARRVRQIVTEYRHSEPVRERINRNVRRHHKPLTRTSFWHSLMMSLLTTQQPSGPNSNVSRLLNRRPFPLRYRRCLGAKQLARFVARELRRHGGIRRVDTIGREASENLRILRSREGATVIRRLKSLSRRRTARAEREASHLLADTFLGIGPKQSRNLLQDLGLTRYEIPIDSRIVKWLNGHGFPVRLSATGLSDRYYYEFILDGVQKMCRRAGVLPCVFDAAVFNSFDANTTGGSNESI